MFARLPFYICTLLLLSSVATAQALGVLATAKVRTFTAADLSPEARKLFENRGAAIEAARAELFSRMIAEELLSLESKAAGVSVDKLIERERAKVVDPTADRINAVYEANRAALGGRALSDVRGEIVTYLRREGEQKVIDSYLASLREKYKFVAGKSVNAADLRPLDVLATLGGRQISVLDFERKNKFRLNDIEHHQYEDLRADLEVAILNALVDEEAKARGTDAASVIAAEVSNKMRDFTEEERETLETALRDRLFAKFDVKILLKEPEIIAQNVSADDDPAIGPAAAPVTVVMFSDFQCPACARTHPVLKRILAGYGGKARLVVRDYPLESIHPDAFNAALAANAAAKQGKFLEYSEMLYRNQSALDRASLLRYAADVGLNARQFEADLANPATAAEVRKDMADGDVYGVSSTPTIFVNGVKVHSLSSTAFRRAIDRAISK